MGTSSQVGAREDKGARDVSRSVSFQKRVAERKEAQEKSRQAARAEAKRRSDARKQAEQKRVKKKVGVETRIISDSKTGRETVIRTRAGKRGVTITKDGTTEEFIASRPVEAGEVSIESKGIKSFTEQKRGFGTIPTPTPKQKQADIKTEVASIKQPSQPIDQLPANVRLRNLEDSLAKDRPTSELRSQKSEVDKEISTFFDKQIVAVDPETGLTIEPTITGKRKKFKGELFTSIPIFGERLKSKDQKRFEELQAKKAQIEKEIQIRERAIAEETAPTAEEKLKEEILTASLDVPAVTSVLTPIVSKVFTEKLDPTSTVLSKGKELERIQKPSLIPIIDPEAFEAKSQGFEPFSDEEVRKVSESSLRGLDFDVGKVEIDTSPDLISREFQKPDPVTEAIKKAEASRTAGQVEFATEAGISFILGGALVGAAARGGVGTLKAVKAIDVVDDIIDIGEGAVGLFRISKGDIEGGAKAFTTLTSTTIGGRTGSRAVAGALGPDFKFPSTGKDITILGFDSPDFDAKAPNFQESRIGQQLVGLSTEQKAALVKDSPEFQKVIVETPEREFVSSALFDTGFKIDAPSGADKPGAVFTEFGDTEILVAKKSKAKLLGSIEDGKFTEAKTDKLRAFSEASKRIARNSLLLGLGGSSTSIGIDGPDFTADISARASPSADITTRTIPSTTSEITSIKPEVESSKKPLSFDENIQKVLSFDSPKLSLKTSPNLKTSFETKFNALLDVKTTPTSSIESKITPSIKTIATPSLELDIEPKLDVDIDIRSDFDTRIDTDFKLTPTPRPDTKLTAKPPKFPGLLIGFPRRGRNGIKKITGVKEFTVINKILDISTGFRKQKKFKVPKGKKAKLSPNEKLKKLTALKPKGLPAQKRFKAML